MTDTLDFSSRAVRPGPDFSSRAVPPPPPRSSWDRLATTFIDGVHRNPLAAGLRWMTGNERAGTTEVRDPETKQVIQRRTTTPDEAARINDLAAGQERARREAYGRVTEADPWYRAPGGLLGRTVAGASTLSGAVGGGASDPVNWLGGGGRTVLSRVAGEFAVNAAGDAATQGIDINTGVQDRYDLNQTVAAGAIGSVMQGGFEVAPRAGRAAVNGARGALDFSSRAVRSTLDAANPPNPVPAFDGPAMDASIMGAINRSARAEAPRQSTLFAAPVSGPVSSDFGPRTRPNPRASANHQGLDYAVPEGTPVNAAADGEVIFAGRRGNYGNRVAIRHADGTETSYSHLSKIDVKPGDRINAGQPFARSGSTGNVTGPHLHFEVSQGGRYVDPAGVLGSEVGVSAAVRAGAREGGRQSGLLSPELLPVPVRQMPGDEALGIDPAASPAVPTRGGLLGSSLAEPAGRGLLSKPQPVGREAGVSRPVRAGARGEGRLDPQAILESITPRLDAEAPPARLNAEAPDFSARAVRPVESAPDFAARAMPGKRNVDMSGYADRIGQTVQSGGQTVGGLRQAPRPGAIPRVGDLPYGGHTVSKLAADLRNALGLTHRQGRVTSNKALGEYDTGSGVIRTKAVDELDVLAHEATHALEYERKGPALAAALSAHAKELEGLAYPGAAAGVKREEGFAEFGRWYLTNPDHARRIAPRFYDAFDAAMRADAPDVHAKLGEIQGAYQELLSSASIDVAKASIAYTGRKGTLPDLVDEMKRRGVGSTVSRLMDGAYTALVDDLHPISVAVRKLSALYRENNGKKLDLKRAADPYALARLSREAYAAGHMDLMHGVTPYRGLDPQGPSLADALETAGLNTTRTGKLENDALREFDVYLIARRMVHEWDRYARGDLPNPPDRNTRAFHEQVIADAEAANPTWRDASGQVYDFLNNLWLKEFEAGLITEASFQNGMTAHPDYVPLMRDMADKGPGRAGKPRGALQFAGGVKAFEGSSRDIISPLSTIMRRAYELNAIIKRNDTLKALDDLAQAAGRGAGAIVERLPAKEIEAVTINAADALQKTADELGLSGRDLSTMQKFADDAASADAEITLFKQSEFSPRKGEAVVFVWRDGQKTPLLLPDGEFGQQMFQALAGMNKELSNIVVDAMAGATQLLRYGVTLSPEFMAANLIRDALATWINTDVGFIPGFDTIRGGVSEIAQDQTAKRYASVGGMRGGANVAATSRPFPKTDAEAEAQLQHLRRKGWKVNRFASWRGLAELTDLSETSTRMGVFKRGYDQAKRRGLSDYEAVVESGFTSRDYLDFGRRGSKMLTASRVVTFLNAAVQGLDKSGRVLSAGGNLRALLTPLSKEARTPAEKRALAHAYKAWAKLSVLGALGLGLRMLYADDPEYQEINDRLRATHWVAKIGGQWVFVPKPFELATLSNIFERTYEGAVLKDPTAGERLISDFSHTIAPPHEIPALSIPFQIGANRDHLGRPIVPDHLRGTVEPSQQFNAFTSDLGKLIGRTFNVSPAVVDHIITGYGGSLGRYVLQGSNLAGETITGRPRTAAGPEDMFLARRFVRSINRGSTSQAEFWDQVSQDGGEMTRAEGTFRQMMRDGRDDEASAYLNRLPETQRAYVLAKVFAGDGESIVHPLVRAQKAVGALGDFRTDAREGTLRGQDGQVIPLSPQDRRHLDDAVAELAQAEMRNALISTGVRGWEQKQPIDGAAIGERLRRISPAAFAELQTRLYLETAPTAIWPEATATLNTLWGAMRPNLSRQMPADRLVPAIRQRRLQNGDTAARYQEGQRIIGGAYAPQPGAPDFSARAR